MNTTMTIRISSELKSSLEAKAQENKQSMSEYLRNALENAVSVDVLQKQNNSSECVFRKSDLTEKMRKKLKWRIRGSRKKNITITDLIFQALARDMRLPEYLSGSVRR